MIIWGNFANCYWICLIILILLTIVGLNFKHKSWVCQILTGRKSYKLIVKFTLWGMALIAIAVALLGPRWGVEALPEQMGRDLLVALDVSKSMLVEDLQPNRLECAKRKITKLIQSLSDCRVGLILFSHEALIYCPLTSDLMTVQTFLDDVSPETISTGTTDLSKPIDLAVQLLENSGADRSQLLAIFTDGEDFSAQLPSAASRAKQAGVCIFAVGVATEQGGRVPRIEQEVTSKLNSNLLINLAQQCAGIYQPVRMDNDSDLQNLTDFLVKFEQHQVAELNRALVGERYYYFNGIALGCLVLEWLI